MMSFKLALRNVKKSYRDYFVYFVTLTISVAMFYVFNTFQQQSAVLDLNEMQLTMLKQLGTVMIVLSIIIMMIFAFLMMVANNFLIKRRKKEFGTYLVLGMSHKQVGLIIVLETLIVALFSLLAGLTFGLLLSQLGAFLTARFLNVGISFKFFFSTKALKLTVFMFFLMFVAIGFLNQYAIRKLNLIDLLYAEKKNEKLSKFKNIGSFFIFIISIVMIGTAYGIAQVQFKLLSFFPLIMFLGIVGTILFVRTISLFFFTLISKHQSFYFKGLNPFIARQLGSKIKTTYKTISTVSILLLFAIVTLVSAANINHILSEQANKIAKYDMSVSHYGGEIDQQIMQEINKLNAETVFELHQYRLDQDDVIQDYYKDSSRDPLTKTNLIALSEFNQALVFNNQEAITLQDGEVFVYFKIDESYMVDNGFDYDSDYIGETLKVLEDELVMVTVQKEQLIPIANASGISANLIVSDDFIARHESLALDRHILNVMHDDAEAIQSFLKYSDNANGLVVETKLSITQSLLGIQLMFAYIALYLGMVFLLSATLILALQQLSESSDNIARYKMLADLGTDDVLINDSLVKQVRIYFLLPIVIALVHAYFGIRAVNVNLDILMMKSKSLKPTLFVMGLIAIFYYLYYRFTVRESLAIIKRDEK